MSRHGWLASVGAALVLMACGCLSVPSRLYPLRESGRNLADLPPVPAPAASPEAMRGQMPDAPVPPNNAVCHLITLPVDRPPEAEHASPADRIRAVVNGELILDGEVMLASHSQLRGARTPKEANEIIKQALEVLIEREILLQEAITRLKRGGKQGEAVLKKIEQGAEEEFEKKWMRPILKDRHLSGREELAALMRQQGGSLEVMRRYWVRNLMSNQYLYARIGTHIDRIGHTEIMEYYNEHRDDYMQPDRVEWQDIFIDAGRHASPVAAREFAEALVQRVRQGEDFAKLSAEFDNGESGKYRKGAGQGHKHGEIFPPEAEPKLFQMRDGDTNVVECAHGYHIVHLVKRQYAGPIPFDDGNVQKEIRNKIRDIVFKRERESIVKELKRKSVIDRCD